jgi:oligosaccharyltransferase complex subunit delta (ribophorin II)
MGANLDHAAKAVSGSASHILFFGSIIAMEGVYFLYYSGWKLFAVLPLMSIIGLVAFLSGSKALGEVQRRRLAGER